MILIKEIRRRQFGKDDKPAKRTFKDDVALAMYLDRFFRQNGLRAKITPIKDVIKDNSEE